MPLTREELRNRYKTNGIVKDKVIEIKKEILKQTILKPSIMEYTQFINFSDPLISEYIEKLLIEEFPDCKIKVEKRVLLSSEIHPIDRPYRYRIIVDWS